MKKLLELLVCIIHPVAVILMWVNLAVVDHLAPTELAMLRELAEGEGESESVALRRAIRQAYAARLGDKKQPRRR